MGLPLGQGGGEGRRPRFSTGREGVREGQGACGVRAVRRATRSFPPQGGLFQERLSARGCGQGGESPESGYEHSIPWVRGRRTSGSLQGPHVASSQGNRKCPLALGCSSGAWGRGCQPGFFSRKFSPILTKSGCFLLRYLVQCPPPLPAPLLPAARPPSEGRGREPGLAHLCSPTSPRVTRATCAAVDSPSASNPGAA